MDVRRLEVLRELKLRGSVTAVAKATFRTPSAVSQQLKALEREAGMALTERSGRGVVLTSAGEALAESAIEIAVAVERADALWQAYMRSPAGEVRLATFPTAGQMFLPGLFGEVGRVPGLRVVATDVDPQHGDFAGLTNDFDVVLGHSVGPNPKWSGPGLTVVQLLDEPLDVAVPDDHPLAAHEALTPSMLVHEPWIGVPQDFPFERVLGEIARVGGAPLRIVQRFSDTRITEALVAAGIGVAVLPRYTSGRPGSGIVLRPLHQVTPTRHLAALVRSELRERPSVSAVLDGLRRIAATFG